MLLTNASKTKICKLSSSCNLVAPLVAVVVLGRFVLPPFVFQVGEDGRVYAAVQYPSMSELWPDIYRTKAVRVAQVSSTRCHTDLDNLS